MRADYRLIFNRWLKKGEFQYLERVGGISLSPGLQNNDGRVICLPPKRIAGWLCCRAPIACLDFALRWIALRAFSIRKRSNSMLPDDRAERIAFKNNTALSFSISTLQKVLRFQFSFSRIAPNAFYWRLPCLGWVAFCLSWTSCHFYFAWPCVRAWLGSSQCFFSATQ